MRFLFLFLLFLTSCGAVYETEKSLQDKLSWYIGKGQTELTNYLGTPKQKLDHASYTEVIYLKETQKTSIEEQYKYSCTLSFFINKKTKKIDNYEYEGQKCYGLGAVHINSNFR